MSEDLYRRGLQIATAGKSNARDEKSYILQNAPFVKVRFCCLIPEKFY